MNHQEEGTKPVLFPPLPIPSRIVFPDNGEVRARKVVRRSNPGHVYKFPSTKNRRMMELESSIERDRAALLEVDPYVKRFSEQPFRIDYSDAGRVRVMFPDFLVERIDGSLTVEEIKPKKEADDPENRRRFDLEKRMLAQHGYLFELHSDTEIRSGSKLGNANRLLSYRGVFVHPLMREAVKDRLRKGSLTGTDLVNGIPKLSDKLLFAMLTAGHIVADLSVPLDMSSRFSRA